MDSVSIGKFLQGDPGPQGQKGGVGEFGQDGNILIIVDPETGKPTQELVFWINLISEILNVTQLAEKGEPGEPVSRSLNYYIIELFPRNGKHKYFVIFVKSSGPNGRPFSENNFPVRNRLRNVQLNLLNHTF